MSRWMGRKLIGALAVGCCFMVVFIMRPAQSETFRMERIARGSSFYGLQALVFDSRDRLYAGSYLGKTILQISTKGKGTPLVTAPQGISGELLFLKDDSLIWSSIYGNHIYSRGSNGQIREIASDIPAVRSFALRADGALFALLGDPNDSIYEVDYRGRKPSRKIIDNLIDVVSIAFGPGDVLYGAARDRGQVVKFDLLKGTQTIIAEGLRLPTAIRFDSKGNLFVADSGTGQIIQIDLGSGMKTLVAKLKGPFDGMAINGKDEIYVSSAADNSVNRVDPESGRSHKQTQAKLGTPGGIAIVGEGDVETLLVADSFAFRTVDLKTKNVNDIVRAQPGALDPPIHVAVGGRGAYLSSWPTGSVQRIDWRTGKLLEIFRNFNQPTDVVALAGQAFLVAEYGSGNLLKISGKQGKDREVLARNFDGPCGLALEGETIVYVSETNGGRIVRTNLADGTKTQIIGGLKQPEGIARTPDGQLIVAEVGERRLLSVNPVTGKATVIVSGLPIGLDPFVGAPRSFIPTGVAVGKTGTIYFSSDIENAIYRVTKQP